MYRRGYDSRSSFRRRTLQGRTEEEKKKSVLKSTHPPLSRSPFSRKRRLNVCFAQNYCQKLNICEPSPVGEGVKRSLTDEESKNFKFCASNFKLKMQIHIDNFFEIWYNFDNCVENRVLCKIIITHMLPFGDAVLPFGNKIAT